ncbi:MAG: hypothetical protein ABJD97_13415, partial [Betaproteobacteria bacterium]
MARLLIAVLVAAGALYWFTHRGVSEGQVASFYATQVQAFGKQDLHTICAQYAPEYKGTERQVSAAGVQVVHADKDFACKNYEFLFEFKKKFDARQTDGGELATELELAPGQVEIAKDGKSADVHLHVHVDFGGAFVADADGVDHLVLRDGRLLSAAS